MGKIRWTSEAQTWLKDIHDYIAQENPSAALKVVRGIYQKAQTLKQFPEIGYVYRIEREGEIRILPYGHYRIAYLKDRQKQSSTFSEFFMARWI